MTDVITIAGDVEKGASILLEGATLVASLFPGAATVFLILEDVLKITEGGAEVLANPVFAGAIQKVASTMVSESPQAKAYINGAQDAVARGIPLDSIEASPDIAKYRQPIFGS
jgi:hypothetical protein